MHPHSYKPHSSYEVLVFDLYFGLVKAWNTQDANAFASHFGGPGLFIRFDGTRLFGQAQFETGLKQFFGNNSTGVYKAKVNNLTHLHDGCILLNAIAGMIPAMGKNIEPSRNAIQSMVATRHGKWIIDLFQNTAAQFHGRPGLVEAMTSELSELKDI